MGLQKYTQKRNFKETAEPRAGKSGGKGLIFVVHRHHASQLHYDFRLEMDGVLKSWAVPKGPSLNPKDKRLAMMVEDHPYDYRTFEGVIPKGNYGAGLVSIFDSGKYESLDNSDNEKTLKKGLLTGNLKFRLFGKILKGEFALVKIKGSEQNAWLLIKHQDEYAVSDKFNCEDLVSETVKKQGLALKLKSSGKDKNNSLTVNSKMPSVSVSEIPYQPMLAKLSSTLFDDVDWIYEKKQDGYRCLAFVEDSVKLISRNGIDFSETYKPVQKDLGKLDKNAVIDGELVVLDKKGLSVFQELQNYNDKDKKFKLKFYVFDLLYLDGHDLRQLPLLQRKELLKSLLKSFKSDWVVYNDHVKTRGTLLFQKAKKEGWEGIVAKKANSTYQSKKRSDSWLKFKIDNTQEAVICGFTNPAGSRKYFGALVLGVYTEDKLSYIGNCGTGFSEATLKDLNEKMIRLITKKNPFDEPLSMEKNINWIKPLLVCDVNYSGWTQDKRLRHPVFKGLRIDKNAEEIQPEIPDLPDTEKKSNPMKAKKTNSVEIPEEREEKFGSKKLKLTNLNKLYWQNEGIKKGQLLEYYRQISPYLLPYLKDRPLSLNRHPNGIDSPGFFQKDLNIDQIPSWIKSIRIYSDSTKKYIDYLICNDLPTLLWMVNLGCIEINPWLSTYKKPENPDFVVIDLDPQDVKFEWVVEAALKTGEVIERMNLTPYIKTSGSRGLHIFIYLGAKYDYDQVKLFAEYLANVIHTELPLTTSIERSPAKRKNLIYLDFLQNRKGQTIAATYSARPRPGATVSTPLNWNEVNEKLNPTDYTIFNTMDRIKSIKDPWENIWKEKANLQKALEKLKKSPN